jgi:DNA helicase-4
MLDGGFSYILGFAALAGLIKLFSKIKNDDKKLEFLFHQRETFLQINHYLKNTFNGKKFVTEKDIKSLSDKYKNITKLDIPEKMREKDENFYDLIIENKNYLFDLHGERLKNNEKFTSGSQKKYLNIFSNPKGQYSYSQVFACINREPIIQVVASAGSGKTSTIVGRAKYLLNVLNTDPNKILVLVFARNAQEEINERLSKNIGVQIETFHSFAYKNLGLSKKPDVSELTQDILKFDKFVENEISKICSKIRDKKLVYDYFAHYLRPYKSIFDFNSLNEYTTFLKQFRSNSSLKGERLKSIEECEIANFLYLNGVDYVYEKKYEYDLSNEKKRQYKPDFYLPEYSLYIEHFALDENGQAPLWFKDKNYAAEAEWKKTIHSQYGTLLISTYSYQKRKGILIIELERQLKSFGVKFNKNSEKEILKKLKFNSEIRKFSQLCVSFLNHYKSSESSFDELKNKSLKYEDSHRYQAFLKIFKIIFDSYEKKLKEENEIDFSDMINLATQNISKNENIHFDEIIIDEFQDISSLRLKLVKSLINNNENTSCYAVGDDWQSIFKFAGSRIDLFSNFGEKDKKLEKIIIPETYRFSQSIAEISQKFILKNPSQIKKEITSSINNKLSPIGVFFDEEEFLLEQILKKITSKKNSSSILVLGRYKNSKPQILEKYSNQNIQFKTIHSSKGEEADYVIINLINSPSYKFPSEIMDDPLLNLVIEDNETYPFAEERRLFYVALTRAKKQIFLIDSDQEPSSFTIEVINDFDPTIKQVNSNKKIYGCKKCKNGIMRYVESKEKKFKPFYSCSNFPVCKNSYNLCGECEKGYLIDKDENLKVCSNQKCQYTPEKCFVCSEGDTVILDGRYGKFRKCFNCGNTSDLD